ncbi:MAG: DEAD/DEAH box helicase, partial [Firmicutes bacterium]|nr:DEAD/DEAH box helicase [Bacillota bacterium]
MNFGSIMLPLESLDGFRTLKDSIENRIDVTEAHGLSDVQKAMIIAALSRVTNRTCLIITDNDVLAKKFYKDISFFDYDAAVFLPSSEMIFHKIDAKSNDIRVSRIKALSSLGPRLIICASLEAVLPKLTDPIFFNSKFKKITVGDVMPVIEFIEYFIESGYERVDMIEGKGQFSIRGGIIDFYLPTESYPFRVELFGDEIDSIRYFDLESQRSLEKLDNIRLSPMREILFEKEDFNNGAQKLEDALQKRLAILKEGKDKKINIDEDKFESDIDKMRKNIYFEGIESYISYFPNKDYCIFDYIKDAVIAIDEPNRIRQKYDSINLQFTEQFKRLLEKGEVLPGQYEARFTYEDILSKISGNQLICFNTLLKTVKDFKPKKIIGFISRGMQPFHGKIDFLIEEVKALKDKKYKVLILAGGSERGKRLREELWNFGIEAIYSDRLDFKIQNGQTVITHGHISGGFEFPSIKFAVITDTELLGAIVKRIPKKKGSKIKFFSDLKAGDYIVHEHHGIGQYMGIEQLKVNNITGDYLHIRYYGNDKLYIPTDQFDLIQKYISGERAPRVNRLSGVEWAKTKARARNAIHDLAIELLGLYAERQKLKGFTFSSDTRWQKEFEDLFPYNETPGQLSSIEEIKQDMEMDKVMDRLLCGDVGYGKTEVALRAAFKSIMDGKQVCILVPTTILAQQHY